MEILFDLFKISVVFACLIAGTRRLGMAAALGLGVLLFALLSGLPLDAYIRVTRQVFTGGAFWFLELMMACLLTFTEVFVRSGLCDRLVRALEGYITSPRGRLVMFPVLLALLPVPGGAILSCPMVESASRNMTNLSQERRAVINYWFRHCLETVWPFYPGFVLVCAMGSVDMFSLPLYLLPMPILTLLGGRIFLLRDIQMEPDTSAHGAKSLAEVFWGSLPLLVTICTALICMLMGRFAGISFFSDWAFAIAPTCGMLSCLTLSGKGLALVTQCLVSARVRQILLLMIAVFYFKEFLAESNFVEPFVAAVQTRDLLPLVFIIIPFIAGLAVGLYAGFVALSFPVLMPMLAASPALWDNRLAYIVLAVIFGQAGQLLSPTHACFMFSCEYFKARLADTWKRLLPPVAVVMLGGMLWFWILV